MSLKILITNLWLWPPTGTAVYVRDLALELKRRGHNTAVFSTTHGDLADELRDAGVLVMDRPGGLPWSPDVIHAHMYAPTRVALQSWPQIPAIHVCHDHSSREDRTPLDPRILRHFGVSQLCLDRVLRQGAPRDRSGLLFNFVDTARFAPRGRLPSRPSKALVFLNNADTSSHLPAIGEACRRQGIDLDVVGVSLGRLVRRPEDLLGKYDLVFAKAKAAIEAMATGAAVILCDSNRIGPMVTSAGFDVLRPLNFGFAALLHPVRPETVLSEIGRYDPTDAGLVSKRIRSEGSLHATVDRLTKIYAEVIEEHSKRPRSLAGPRTAKSWDDVSLRLMWMWGSLPKAVRTVVKSLPGYRLAVALAHRWFGA